MAITPHTDEHPAPGGARRALTREGWTVVGIVLASLAVRVPLAAALDVFQDEAIYWWQGHTGVTFCPHPPAVPMLARAGVVLFGQGVFALRIASLLWGTASIVLAYWVGRDLAGRRAGVWAAALFAACPFFLAVGVILTPDALLVVLWLLFLWVTWRAAQTDAPRWWAASGVVLAAGLYTKYMMILAAPCALFALSATAKGRARLRRPGPWAALAVGLGLFLPAFVAWNVQHDWSAVRYHLAARHEWTPSFVAHAPAYIGGHAAAFSPVLYVGMLAAFVGAWRAWRRGAWSGAWLFSFGVGPILFFLAPSLFTEERLSRVQWDEIGYAVGIVALACAIAPGGEGRERRRWRRTGVAALALALVMSLALSAVSRWPGLAAGAGIRVPTRQMEGWREVTERVEAMDETWPGGRPIVVTRSFKTAVCLGFRRGREDIYTLEHRRNERYGLIGQLAAWGIDERHLEMERGDRDALYVIPRGHEVARPHKPNLKRIRRFFTTVEPVDAFDIVRGGHPLFSFHLFRCTGRRDPAAPADDP